MVQSQMREQLGKKLDKEYVNMANEAVNQERLHQINESDSSSSGSRSLSDSESVEHKPVAITLPASMPTTPKAPRQIQNMKKTYKHDKAF